MNDNTKRETATHQAVMGNHAGIPIIGHMHKSILLIDDDQSFRRVLRMRLENWGFVCQEAADGLQALSLVDGGFKMDLVVSDYHMPIINGLEFLKALSYRVNGQEIPVILLSGHWTSKMKNEAKLAGALDLLTKPYDDQELLTLVCRACR